MRKSNVCALLPETVNPHGLANPVVVLAKTELPPMLSVLQPEQKPPNGSGTLVTGPAAAGPPRASAVVSPPRTVKAFLEIARAMITSLAKEEGSGGRA